MSMLRRALALALVVGAVSGSALAASAGPHLTAWGPAQKLDEIAGNHPDLNTRSPTGARSSRPTGSACTWPRTAQAARAASTSGLRRGRARATRGERP